MEVARGGKGRFAVSFRGSTWLYKNRRRVLATAAVRLADLHVLGTVLVRLCMEWQGMTTHVRRTWLSFPPAVGIA